MKKNILLLVAIVMLASCEKHELDFTNPDIPSDLTLTKDIQPIFTKSCISCHPPTKGLDLTEGSSYNALVPKFVVAGKPDESLLISKLSESLHDPKASVSEKQYIYAWIEQGAKE